jgi:hypothetical protein
VRGIARPSPTERCRLEDFNGTFREVGHVHRTKQNGSASERCLPQCAILPEQVCMQGAVPARLQRELRQENCVRYDQMHVIVQ